MKRGRPLEQSYFGRNLYFLRNRRGLTQEVLAENLRITRARLGAYEENRNQPCHLMSYRIAQYFNVNLQNMITKNLAKK